VNARRGKRCLPASRDEHRREAALAALVAATFALAAGAATSSIGGSYELDAEIVGAGATTLSGANGLASDVLIGQNNAAVLSGANGYTAATGFWNVAVRGGASDRVFEAGFEASSP
jgi:hypothetical protein